MDMNMESVTNTAEVATDPSLNPAPETPTPSAPTPAQPDEKSPSVSDPASPAEQAAAKAVAAFTPNMKFKVMDKEHEFPAFLKDVIKDQATEKQLKEIFEKAYGLDVVKPRFLETRQKFQDLRSEHDGLMSSIAELRSDYQKGDMDSFFEKLQIPHEKILQWVADKIQYNELPPEQRQVLDARKAAERRAMSLEKQTSDMQRQFQEQISQAKKYALDVSLEKPDVKSFATQYDSQPGRKPGDFVNRVVERGELAWYTKNVDLSPEQAIQEVMALYGTPPALGTQTNAQVTGGTQTPPNAQKTPVIPNVSGRTTSSVKAKPKSLDDLKKIYQSMQA